MRRFTTKSLRKDMTELMSSSESREPSVLPSAPPAPLVCTLNSPAPPPGRLSLMHSLHRSGMGGVPFRRSGTLPFRWTMWHSFFPKASFIPSSCRLAISMSPFWQSCTSTKCLRRFGFHTSACSCLVLSTRALVLLTTSGSEEFTAMIAATGRSRVSWVPKSRSLSYSCRNFLHHGTLTSLALSILEFRYPLRDSSLPASTPSISFSTR
mmetsp:Transcript_7143/g.24568  ORF Transcript_7143/g.24568 Transcript_7143/m.24568 type:complete len:209 (+) Transcript_7143:3567-4193(+)